MATEGILDASTIVSLVVPEEFSDWSSATLKRYKYLGTLELASYETTNALRNKVMQKELNENDANRALKEIMDVISSLDIHFAQNIIASSLALSLECNISVYDAAYLSLAKRLNSKLITLDTKFANKLKGTKYYDLLEHP